MNPTTSSRAAACACEQPIRFGGATLGDKRHICAFFSSPQEEYEVLMPFIKEGFERGEKAFHVVAPELRSWHLQRMVAGGIDVVDAQDRGQFELCDWSEMYLPDGRFDQYRMMAAWDSVLGRAGAQGYPRTRIVAHMEWSLEENEGVSDLLEYEARFNLRKCDHDPVVCTYALNRYNGATIMDIIRTHPMVLLGGLLQENPFYVEPQEFIRELHARQAQGTVAPSRHDPGKG
jgi:hypothetical protein